MANLHLIRDSFNAGELSPLLSSRFQVEKVAAGCRKLRNFIPHVHGPAFRRPGLEYIGANAGEGAPSSLRGFNFSTTTSYVLEFHPSGLRVWSTGENPELVALLADVELPYNAEQCREVQAAGVNDTIYLVHPEKWPQVLTRGKTTGTDNDWQIADFEPDWPALGDENVRSDEIASPDVTEALSVPTLRWPEFELTSQEVEFSVVNADTGPTLKKARFQRRNNADTDWVDIKVFSWHGVGPSAWTDDVVAGTFRLVYEGIITVTGLLRINPTTGANQELPIDVIQPAVDEVSDPVGPGEWQARVTAPANVPAGSEIVLQRLDGSTWKNIKKLQIIPNQTTVYRGATLTTAKQFRFDWNGERAMTGGEAVIEELEFPPSEDVTLTCNGTEGEDRTLTASEPLFEAGHVGSYWQLTHRRDASHVQLLPDVNAVPDPDTFGADDTDPLRVVGTWDVFSYGIWKGTLYLEKKVAGAWEVLRSWQSNNDRNVVANGTEDHEVELRLRCSSGECAPSDSAARPRFVLEAADSRVSGIVKITAVGSLNDDGKATTATVDVIRPLHATTATSLWTEGAWSSVKGFPRSVAIHGQRLWFGGTAKEPQRIWGSVVADFLNFRRSTLDDAGVSFTPAAQPGNPIQWMIGHGKELVVGTAGNEFTLSSEGPIVTPVDVLIEPRSGYGSAYLQAVALGDGVAFVQRGGRKLRQIMPRSDVQAWSAADLVVLAEHIAKSGIRQVAVQTHPFTVFWCVATNGTLCGMTYEQEQNVFAWHVHETDGLFESVAVVRGVDADEVWFSVNRDGARSIERFDPLVLARAFEDPSQLMYVDAALRVAGPVTTVAGLGHLEGQEVVILADGAEHPRRTVAAGVVTLEAEATTVIIGLPFESKLQPMKIDIPLRDGTAQGRQWKVARVMLTLHESLGGEVADSETGSFSKLSYRVAADAMDAAPPLFNGDKETLIDGRSGDSISVMVKTSAPLPFNVGAIVIKSDVYGE